MLQGFKKFALRGNVIDLAVGVVIGGAFGKIVASLVGDIIMPLFGAAMGGRSVSDLKYVLQAETETTAELAVMYGLFFQSIIDFLIIAFSIFLFIQFFQTLRKKEEEQLPEPSAEEKLLTEIRDILKSN